MVQIYGPNPNEINLRHLRDFFAIRKSYFVDKLGWKLCHTGGREWDEYDLPNAYFMVAYENDVCVGGARLLPTDNQLPRATDEPLTYMLADFAEGRIPVGMSKADLTEALPRSFGVWEMTRFVAESPKITGLLLDRANQFLHEIGAHEVLTLSPKMMPRVLRRLGYQTQVMSEALTFDDREYVALRTQVQVHEPVEIEEPLRLRA